MLLLRSLLLLSSMDFQGLPQLLWSPRLETRSLGVSSNLPLVSNFGVSNFGVEVNWEFQEFRYLQLVCLCGLTCKK